MASLVRSISAAALMSALAWLSGVQTAGAQSEVWTTNGPASGNVNALAIDAQLPTTLYAGTEDGGVFKSTDAGGSWNAVNNGLPGLTVYALAVDPQLPTTLYASISGSGIFKSADAGDSWTAVNSGIPPSIRGFVFALAIDPQTPTNLYAGTNDGGVFKSSDGGATWNHAPGVSPVTVATLAVDPQTPTTVYAGTDLNLWKSTDAASSWSATGLDRVTVFALAIDPDTPTTLYAGVRSFAPPPGSSGVLKSIDGGATWSAVNNGLPGLIGRALTIHPQDPTTVYVGTSGGGVFETTDGGASWSAINEGLTHLAVSGLAIDPQAATLYAATKGGGVFARTIDRPSFMLTVRKSGPGDGIVTSEPAGLDCGGTCSASYQTGTTVKLTATPCLVSIFTGWTGCDSVSGRLCWVTMSEEKSVTANFLGIRLPAQVPCRPRSPRP